MESRMPVAKRESVASGLLATSVEGTMRVDRRAVLTLILAATTATTLAQHEDHQPANSGPEEGLGRAHMDISCAAAAAQEFDKGLALLHNFWYVRAFERFN